MEVERIVFEEPSTSFWTARAVYPDNVKPKYKNAPGSSRDVVWNLPAAANQLRIIVTEGVISQMVAGPSAVCTFGKQVTDQQIAQIAEVGRPVYVALDGDALREGIKLADKFLRRGVMTYLVKLPYGEDPASLGRDDFIRRTLSARIYSLREKFNCLNL